MDRCEEGTVLTDPFQGLYCIYRPMKLRRHAPQGVLPVDLFFHQVIGSGCVGQRWRNTFVANADKSGQDSAKNLMELFLSYK